MIKQLEKDKSELQTKLQEALEALEQLMQEKDMLEGQKDMEKRKA